VTNWTSAEAASIFAASAAASWGDRCGACRRSGLAWAAIESDPESSIRAARKPTGSTIVFDSVLSLEEYVDKLYTGVLCHHQVRFVVCRSNH